jgi:nucleoside-diphosphate-sugar epimerase
MVDRDVATLVQRIQPSHLLHLAWYAVPGAFWTAPDNLDWVAASLRLLRQFSAAGGHRAVFAGSCAEYDWTHEVLCEAITPLHPRTLYGKAKNALRTLVEAAAPDLGVSAAWGRIFLLYGPHEPPHRLMSDIAAALLRGEHAQCSHGRQERDFLHVADVAAAMVALLDSDVAGPVNIASGVCRPVRDLVEQVAQLFGRPDLPRFGERPLAPDEPERLVADVTILHKRVGFSPRFGFEDGLADTVEWWKRQQNAVAAHG